MRRGGNGPATRPYVVDVVRLASGLAASVGAVL